MDGIIVFIFMFVIVPIIFFVATKNQFCDGKYNDDSKK